MLTNHVLIKNAICSGSIYDLESFKISLEDMVSNLSLRLESHYRCSAKMTPDDDVHEGSRCIVTIVSASCISCSIRESS